MRDQEIYTCIKKEIKIESYAKELGFSVVRKGRYFSLKEHDSVIIDPEKNCFWRNSDPGSGNAIGRGGSVIDFALEFTNLTLHEVLKMFTTRVRDLDFQEKGYSIKKPLEEKDVKEERYVNLPCAGANMRKVFAYLIRTRRIAKEIVQEFVDRKQLYQDDHGNCVFVSYDLDRPELVAYACRRGTNTYFSFYGDVEGNDYRQGFYVNNHAARLYVTESVIDAMSIMTLMQRRGKDWKQFNYLALAGVGKAESLRTYLEREPIEEIRIATDQDEGGRKAVSILEQIAYEMKPGIKVILALPKKEGQDWNQVLQGIEEEKEA